MIRTLLLAIAVFSSISAFSQKIPLIRSGDVIDQGIAAYDSGNYEDAIKTFLKVSPRDTNYVFMLAELALAYNGAQEYEKTIEVCDEGLKQPSPYRAMLMKTKAIALDKKGDYPKSVELFEKAMALFPTDQNLVFNLGVTHFNNKEFEKAKDSFFRSLSINPYHSASHLNLGAISIKEGRKTHALLSYGLYLAINNEDNPSLVLLNNFLANEAEEEGTLTPAGTNAFDKLDQVIRAKLALEKSFKTKVPVDAAVVKQTELFFQQLDMYDKNVNDPWAWFYLPIYKAFRDKNAVEPFIYHLLSSSANETVKKWHKKNEKTLSGFYDLANTEIRGRRTRPIIPGSSGIDRDLPGWYNDNSKLIAYGREDSDGKDIGAWTYFYTNGEKSAEGVYKKGAVKTGVWKYYNSSGILTSEENQETGEITTYYDTGEKSQHYFIKDGKTHGLVEVFYPCGSIKERFTYKDGQVHGKGEVFYSSGQKKVEYNYENGKLSGEYKTWYEDGKLKSIYVNKDHNANGPYIEYFNNGKVSKSGDYLDDKLDGVWKYYYSNGRLSRTGSYANDLGEGEWTFYNQRGELTERRNLKGGKYHGEDKFYVNGNLFFVNTYDDGKLKKVVYYDEGGKVTKEFGSPDGNFSLKGYFSTGELRSEGEVKDGELSGKWKYYYRTGQLLSEYIYEKGLAQGPFVSYHPSGAVKVKAHYVDNQFHGFYQEFFEHGPVKFEGWYQDGKRQQQFLAYTPTGKLESDYYYLDDNLKGATYDYFDGKNDVYAIYHDGLLTHLENYNSRGENLTRAVKDGTSVVYEVRSNGNTLSAKFDVNCGLYNGSVMRWYSENSLFYSYPMVGGERHGRYQYYAPDGKLQVEGDYVKGNREGTWKGYDASGKLSYVGNYLEGNSDSTWTWFYSNGKPSTIINYLDDERHGITTMFTPDGTPAVEKQYDNGDLIAYRTMTASGNWSEWTKTSGDAVIHAYYPNGKTSVREEFKQGRIVGTKVIYYPDGKIYSEFTSVNGDYHGPFAVYYPNGKPEIKGNYQYDEYDGTLSIYNSDGSLSRTEEYYEGGRSGKVILYQKGAKTKEINFWGGVPNE